MICPKCNGKGFIELEHGIFTRSCRECKGTGEVGEIIGLDMVNNPLLYGIDSYIPPEAIESIKLPEGFDLGGVIDSSSGTDTDNITTRGGDTGLAAIPQKQKARSKARKKTR